MLDGIYGFRGEFRWMSNFHPVQIDFESRRWPSVEHAHQAAKTQIEVEKIAILEAPAPGRAKRLGRTLNIRADWLEVRCDLMLRLQRLKYQDRDLAFLLRRTGARHIEETNTWGDTFWGVCKGVGENQMGKILMEVRDELREPAESR